MSGSALRRLLSLGAGALLLALCVAWLSGACEARIAPGEVELAGEALPAGASTALVEASRMPVTERASGTVASAHEITVAAKILARIAEVPVRAGSVVSSGDLLVRLESRDLEARAAEAEEQLRGARARLELAGRERERAEKLLAEDAASRQQVDRAVSAFRVARADVLAAEQRAEDARVALSYAEIRAPASGRVVDRLAEPGDTAAPGAPLLRVYDPGSLRLEAPVRESLAVTLAPGQALTVHVDALGRDFTGTIDEIVPFAEPGARTLLVKVRLPSDPQLYAGMFGRVEVPAGERTLLLVPREAIVRVGQLEYATVVQPGGSTARRMVTTGPPRDGVRVEVTSGLREGERVVLPGAGAARDPGDPIS